jgi:hypothetical protein
LSTKVHLIVDALGLPTAFEITEGLMAPPRN